MGSRLDELSAEEILRIRERSVRIRPELASRDDIIQCAKLLINYMHGKAQLVRAGNWLATSMPHEATAPIFYYKGDSHTHKANYVFIPTEFEHTVLLENDHREAFDEYGTSSIAEIEHIGVAMATILKKPVTFVYYTYGQDDTVEFLTLRGYDNVDFTPPTHKRTFPAMVRTVQPLPENS